MTVGELMSIAFEWPRGEPSRMTGRTLVVMVLMLILGAAITVAIAWICAAIGPVPIGSRAYVAQQIVLFRGGEDETCHPGVNAPGLTEIRHWTVRNARGQPTRPLPIWSDAPEGAREYGWGEPYRTMRTWIARETAITAPEDWIHGGIPIMTMRGEVGALPLRPNAWWFALSAVFAGFVVAALRRFALAPAQVRRRWRWDAGRCARCDHDLRAVETPVCQECGYPVSAQPPEFPRASLRVMALAIVALGLGLVAAGWTMARRIEHPPALHAAALAGDLERIEALLSDGANVDARTGRLPAYSDDGGSTVLMYAVASGRTPVVDRVLDAGADPGDGTDLLLIAAAHEEDAMVEHLLANGARVAPAVFREAVGRGSVENVRRFIRAGADVNFEGSHPLAGVWAHAIAGRVEMVRVLVDAGARTDLGAYGTVLGAAIRGRSIEAVETLLEAGVPIDERDWQAAREAGDPRIIEMLERAAARDGS